MSSFLIALQSVELDRLAVYLDSDIIPWHVNKAWEDLLPSEWFQVYIVDRESYRIYVDLFSLNFFDVLF